MKQEPYDTVKKIHGHVNVSLRIPFESYIDIRMEDFGGPELEEDYVVGVDDIINYTRNPKLKSDIDLFERLGWTVEEIECEHD